MDLRFVVAVCTVALASIAAGQEFDRVLLPVAPDRIEGAFGSEWITDLVITNLSGTPIRVSRVPTCVPVCVPEPLPPRATVFVPSLLPNPLVRGQLAFVEKGRLADVAMTLRSRDTSRQAETWGTSVPVIASDELYARRFGLVDIPMDAQFRSTLRIYDANAGTVPRIRVRIYAVTPFGVASTADQLISDFEPSFTVPQPQEVHAFPASAEIPLWLDQELVKHPRIRIEIEPLDEARDYWAMVSITHNTTQHVTLITPHP